MLFQRILDRIRFSDESGFTMLSAATSIMVGTLLSLAAWQTANSDIRFTDNDRWDKVAYQYAQTGVSDYVQHIAESSSYWSYCDQPPGFSGTGLGQSALNDTDIGTTAHPKRRWLPYATDGSATDRALNGQYTIDLVPANNATSCKSKNPRSLSMIDQNTGTLRVRITGRAGKRVPATVADNQVEAWRQSNWTRRSTVIELRRTGFINYGYFTNHDAQDPDLVGGADCDHYYQDDPGYTNGRYRSTACGELAFQNSDRLVGPFHTNDSAYIASFGVGGPIFGSQPGDRVEVYNNGATKCSFRNQAHVAPTSTTNCTNASGAGAVQLATGAKLITGPTARYLGLPETDEDLLDYADPSSGDPDARGYTFRGTTKLELNSDGTFWVTNANYKSGVRSLEDYPTSGVIYVARASGAASCDSDPSAQYPGFGGATGCALAEVQGTYNKSLTIGSQDDIVLTASVQKLAGSNAVMGLIANDYVRIRHYGYYWSGGCKSDGSGKTQPNSITIDAAILTLSRSFTYDASSCGGAVGTIHLTGTLAQNWRGIVINSGNGYLKDYKYDYNLRALSPPHFLSPTTSTWLVGRTREQLPACKCGSTG